ncbi:MAG: hypothetical protein JNM18_15520 [Planctomycetaceae bacterium]|nr:hypothetical protein [Planctomycetaceae bacterium]
MFGITKLFATSTKARNKTLNQRKLNVEPLEERRLMSVNSLFFSGSTLVVKTDNVASNVEVRQSGANTVIHDLGTNRQWSYATSSVGRVQFQGGAGNDRFVNNFSTMPVQAYGNGGDDYLEGYSAADYFDGGAGNDTMRGYSGNDTFFGGAGNDVIFGMIGDDQLVGQDGNDTLDGGDGNDRAWGGNGNDVLLGGNGDDQLVGDAGNDQLNGQLGNDSMWAGDGNDVIIAIDSAFGDYVEGNAGNDVFWVDRVGSSTDRIVGATSADKIQNIASFTNGADRTLNGDRITDPTALSGQTYKRFANNPLFSTSGPRFDDIRQGNLGDCWMLAGLSAVALDRADAIRENVVDFNDGTYGVRLGNSFYRVDDDLPVANIYSTTPANANFGLQNSMWVAIVEKAYAHYRTGANSYASLDGGWAVEVNRAFNSASAGAKSIKSYANATEMVNDMYNRWNTYQSVTVGVLTGSGAPLVNSHMYTVYSFNRNSAGQITSVVLRNPWGYDGRGSDSNTSDGLVTVTPAQLFGYTGQVNWGRV